MSITVENAKQVGWDLTASLRWIVASLGAQIGAMGVVGRDVSLVACASAEKIMLRNATYFCDAVFKRSEFKGVTRPVLFSDLWIDDDTELMDTSHDLIAPIELAHLGRGFVWLRWLGYGKPAHDAAQTLARMMRKCVTTVPTFEQRIEFANPVGLPAVEKAERMAAFSHEIRTPLASVSAAIDLLLEGFVGQVTEEQRDVLETAGSARTMLDRLVQELLEIDLYEGMLLQQQTQDLALQGVCHKVVESVQAVARDRRVRVRLIGDREDMRAQGAHVCADSKRLYRVFDVLAHCAVYGAEVGTVVSIRVDAFKRLQGWVSIQIRFRGWEQDFESIDRLFEAKRFSKFLSTRSASRVTVSLSQRVVEGHGGALFVEQEQGETTFAVVLPSNAGETLHPPLTIDHHAPLIWVRRGDDDGVQALALAAWLARQGFRARIAPLNDQDFADWRLLLGEGCVLTSKPGEDSSFVLSSEHDDKAWIALASAMRRIATLRGMPFMPSAGWPQEFLRGLGMSIERGDQIPTAAPNLSWLVDFADFTHMRPGRIQFLRRAQSQFEQARVGWIRLGSLESAGILWTSVERSISWEGAELGHVVTHTEEDGLWVAADEATCHRVRDWVDQTLVDFMALHGHSTEDDHVLSTWCPLHMDDVSIWRALRNR